jgi:hypothetical protein
VEKSTPENPKTFAFEKNMQGIKCYVSTKTWAYSFMLGRTDVRSSERNNCSKFSFPVFSHPSPALQTADNHVSYHKETATIGVSVLPQHNRYNAITGYIYILFLFSWICLQRRMGAIRTKYEWKTCLHYSVMPKKLAGLWKLRQILPKEECTI